MLSATSPWPLLQLNVVHLEVSLSNGLPEGPHCKLQHVAISGKNSLNAVTKIIHHLIVSLPVSKLVKVELREICHNVTNKNHR